MFTKFSDGFNLPLKLGSAFDSEVLSFPRLMDRMRDAATLSILERLEAGIPKGRFTDGLIDKMHGLAQDLMYFRNVDGSFGDAMAQQTFR